MARGKTLGALLDGLRAACRISLNAAHNVQHREAQIKALQLKQEWFWGDFAWPHLRVDRFLDAQAGLRYYDMPDDLDIDRISHVEVRFGGAFVPVRWGIDAVHYASFDSDLDQRSDPIQRCKIVEDEQLEVWPIAATDFNADTLEGRMKVVGIRKLNPLVNEEADKADLDDQLLILSCAADYLAATGAKDAQLKLDQANRLYSKLRGRLMPRRKFTIGVGSRANDTRPQRIPIAVYNKTS